MNALLLHPELGITKLECRQTIESMLQQNTNNNTAHHMKINKIHSKIIQRMAQYSRVNSRMDLDNNSHQIDGRQRINSILNRPKVSGRGILIHSDCVRGEELILGCLKHRVPEAPNKPYPLHELLFCELGLCHIGRQPLPGGVLGSYSFGVAVCWG